MNELLKMHLQMFADGTGGEDESAGSDESTDDKGEQEETVAKDVMKQRLARKEVQHQKEIGGLNDTLAQIKKELEDLKTESLPPEERKSYKEQKFEREQQEKLDTLTKREQALILKENVVATRDSLSEKEIDTGYTKFLIDTGEFESLDDKLEAFVDFHNSVLSSNDERTVKKMLAGNSPRTHTQNTNTINKETFNKMTYQERVKLHNENKELYNQLTKGD